ncbi:zinc finger, CCHC-type containing protein [Tanacetum coccineum]
METQFLSLLLEITPNLATRATRTPLNFAKESMWYLFDLTPSVVVKNDSQIHGLRPRIANQHLKDFLKLVDSLDLDSANRERMHLHLFQFSFSDQILAIKLERLQQIHLHMRSSYYLFPYQFFPSGRTTKLRNDILMFQQHQEESLSEAWTHFKDLLQKVPHHGIDLWLQVQIFYDHVNLATRRTINYLANGKLHDKNAKES